MIIPDDQQRPHIIKRTEIDIGTKGLGVYLEPSGYEKTQLEIMKTSSTMWAIKMKHNTISRYSVSLGLRTTITKSHQYKLPAMTFSEAQCDLIMKPVYNVILSKIGINKTIPLAY